MNSCTHCGEQIIDSPIPGLLYPETVFCCPGCRGVYELIQSAGLSEYYNLDLNPGISLKEQSESHYEILNSQEVLEEILIEKDGSQLAIKLIIPAIHCSACILLLENLPKMKPGIQRAHVNYPRRELTVHFDLQTIQASELCDFLHSIGYSPVLNSQDQVQMEQSDVLLKLAVAGFCFGNCMLFSFPEYLSLHLEDQFRTVFRALNLFLCSASLLFCSREYFLSAFYALKSFTLSLKVPIALGLAVLYIQTFYEILSGSGPGYADSLTGFLFFLYVGRYVQDRTFENLIFERNLKHFFPLAVMRIQEDGSSEPVTVEKVLKGDRILVRISEYLPFDARLMSKEGSFDYSFISGESRPVLKKEGEYLKAGGKLLESSAIIEVLAPMRAGSMQKLWETMDSKSEENPLEWVDRVARVYTPAILLIALAGFTFHFHHSGLHQAIQVSICVLIIACPCALSLSTPFTGAVVQSGLSKMGFFLKSPLSITGAFNLDTLVLDKTGTLTKTLEQATFHPAPDPEIAGLIYALASHSTHPVSRSIVQSLNSHNKTGELKGVREISGKGIQAQTDFGLLSIQKTHDNVSDAESNTVITLEGKQICKVYFEERPRHGLETILKDLGENHKLVLLSGDSSIRNPIVKDLLRNFENVHLSMEPTAKAQIIDELRKRQRTTAMIGDGLNDSAALRCANFGISVVEDHASFFPGCDLVMEGQSFVWLPGALRYLQCSRIVLQSCLLFSLLYNLIGLYFALSGKLTPVISAILMPLSSLTVVGITMILGNFFLRQVFKVTPSKFKAASA